jgi:hypothetical protein
MQRLKRRFLGGSREQAGVGPLMFSISDRLLKSALVVSN